MHAIILEAKCGSVKETMNSIADAALTGARGIPASSLPNTSTVSFLNLMDEETITIPFICGDGQNAVPYAHQAISDPVEGTIITVIQMGGCGLQP